MISGHDRLIECPFYGSEAKNTVGTLWGELKEPNKEEFSK